MTDSERLSAALAVTLFLHFMVLRADWNGNPAPARGEKTVTVNIEPSGTPAESSSGLAFETAATPEGGEAAVNKRRQARRLFEEEISEAVHARRLRGGQNDLIGVAVYSFVVEATGTFSTITLEIPSGKVAVDAAAREAIAAADGVVKRPAILGNERIQIILPVKFQYDLR